MEPDFQLVQASDIVAKLGISAVPHLADYFGTWHIHVAALEAAIERVNRLNFQEHVLSPQSKAAVMQQARGGYMLSEDGIAVFQISGPMMKYASSLSGGTSTVYLRKQVRDAKNSGEVVGGILLMDTPGGTVKGNRDLCDEVAAFAAEKPLFAFCEDMVASAGVSIASQAMKRYANNATALYGAMGTYSVLMDYSGQAAQLGVKVHVIRAGDYKGMGEPGTEITPEQKAEAQRIVNALNEQYLATIASGLKKPVEQIKALADGRVHPASDAVTMGLINGVQSFEATYAELLKEISDRKSKAAPPPKQQSTGPLKQRSQQMADTSEKIAASLPELKKSFPKSSAEWRESQLEAGASMQEAAIAYATHLEAQQEETAKKHKEELEAAKKGKGPSLGHRPVKATGGGRRYQKEADDSEPDDDDEEQASYESGDAIADFNAQVAKVAGKNPDLKRRQRAVQIVAKRNPDLYQAYLLDANPGKRQSRLITEKLEAVAGK